MQWVPAPDMVEQWMARLDDRRWVYVVAERDGEVVGTCGLDLEGCEVVNAYVDRAHLGNGIGGALLDEVEARARAHGCRTLVVESGSWFRDTGYGFWTARYGPPAQVDEDFYAPGAERVVWRFDLTDR